ncbi:hypothetical protein Ciccas_010593 [Cichlidogyrus casuarinus]|uniref:Insulin-like domain-containing protein n=1 Tax=Cichlidogyrus casuarinus TaxID=1844966 RepID=A0ABD2PTQ5_9PLAT
MIVNHYYVLCTLLNLCSPTEETDNKANSISMVIVDPPQFYCGMRLLLAVQQNCEEKNMTIHNPYLESYQRGDHIITGASSPGAVRKRRAILQHPCVYAELQEEGNDLMLDCCCKGCTKKQLDSYCESQP